MLCPILIREACLLGRRCRFLADNICFYLVCRIIAGVSGSLMIPAVFGNISGSYQGRQQAIDFGAPGAASGFSFAMGPVLCGVLLDTLGW